MVYSREVKRRNLLAGLAASALTTFEARADSNTPQMFIELKTWKLRNSDEDQGSRVSDFLDTGLFPALTRAGAKPVAALANLIAPDGPFYVTAVQYPSLSAMQDVLTKCAADDTYEQAMRKLGTGTGLPFVRIESSLLQCFHAFPEAKIPEDAANRPPRIFELRTYEVTNADDIAAQDHDVQRRRDWHLRTAEYAACLFRRMHRRRSAALPDVHAVV